MNDDHLHRSERVLFYMLSEGHMYTLILVFDGVVKEDAGTITFVANNEAGYASVQAILEVEGNTNF